MPLVVARSGVEHRRTLSACLLGLEAHTIEGMSSLLRALLLCVFSLYSLAANSQ